MNKYYLSKFEKFGANVRYSGLSGYSGSLFYIQNMLCMYISNIMFNTK